MGGGLLQLVAYGAQDVYLTSNPQITFFKVVYRRHTNFSMEAIEQTFNGTAERGKRVTAQISRNGDLIHKMYVVLSGITGDNTYAGYKAIDKVELEIGGQLIDRQYSDWMYIWNELSLPAGKRDGFDKMVGTNAKSGETLYVPLEFWFCRNIGLALPLIALQYHEVKVNIVFSNEFTFGSANLWVDYIFLDTDERRRYAQLSHEYLIEQVQHTGVESIKNSASNKVKLNFNHPVKELVWVNKNSASHFTYIGLKNIKLQFNGNDRFAERSGMYFTHVQPYQHHENIPDSNIHVYSFALKPEEHQVSGTANFSRLDTVTMHVDNSDSANDTDLLIYAVNYNVLRILSGMGGLAYSN
tara:strand:+ start:3164 stop:4228 length:1065 start_codon:yes stop_codon:yes gene_type:complete